MDLFLCQKLPIYKGGFGKGCNQKLFSLSSDFSYLSLLWYVRSSFLRKKRPKEKRLIFLQDSWLWV